MVHYILVVIGFVLLIVGADKFVASASRVAKNLGIPPIIVGLTVVSMGTSAPELAVSISAAISGNSDIAAGNVIGSNIFNLLIVIGAAALVKPIIVNRTILKKDYTMMIAVAALLTGLLTVSNNTLTRLGGGVFLIVTTTYTFFLIRSVRKSTETGIDVGDTYKNKKGMLKDVIVGLLGLGVVIYSGDLVVESAVVIAKQLGMSDTLVGLTIIAIGTSLPELATSITAALKGESELALGNAVGSNIFNIILILGATAVIKPVAFSLGIVYDTLLYIAISIITLVILYKTEKVSRLLGTIMMMAYVAYAVYASIRN